MVKVAQLRKLQLTVPKASPVTLHSPYSRTSEATPNSVTSVSVISRKRIEFKKYLGRRDDALMVVRYSDRSADRVRKTDEHI